MTTGREPEEAAWLGVIAGAGRFPFMVVEGARRAGCRTLVVGLRGFADPALAGAADAFRWSGMARPGSWIRLLRRFGAREVILAGSVRKTEMYGRFRLLKYLPDLTAIRVWFFEIRDKRNDTVLSAIAGKFAERGIVMQACVKYSSADMAPEGVITKRGPTESQREDAAFGWRIAREMGRLDIGQSVAVKEREVIAVEAIEGTDRMIERAGQLCRSGGWTLVKAAKPAQDMRFDVPTVGPETVAALKRHGGKVLVIEAGRTVIVERERMIAEAEAAGIVVVGMPASAG